LDTFFVDEDGFTVAFPGFLISAAVAMEDDEGR